MENIITRYIDKGLALIKEAEKKYQEGNPEIGYKLYTEAASYLTEADKYRKTSEGKDSLIYGDNRNFGVIYQIFEANTKKLLSNNKGRKNLKKILNLIKENKVLLHEFNIYNTFTNPTNVTNVEEYVNEAISLIKQYPKDVLKEENEKLIKLFKEYNLNENIELNLDNDYIFECIETLLTTPKTFNSFQKINDIKKHLCEYVNRNNKVLNEAVDLDSVYDDLKDKFVSKYENVLSDHELQLFKDVSEPEKAKKIFEQYKQELLDLLQEEITKGSNVTEWQAIFEKVQNKKFNKDKVLKDISEFIEIKNLL